MAGIIVIILEQGFQEVFRILICLYIQFPFDSFCNAESEIMIIIFLYRFNNHFEGIDILVTHLHNLRVTGFIVSFQFCKNGILPGSF